LANMANTAAYKLPDGRMAVDVDSAKTLAIADCGYVQNVTGSSTAAVILSVPATATLGNWTIRNKGLYPTSGAVGALTGGATVQVSPVAADQIQGGVAGTAVDNKDLITTDVGAEVRISNIGETNGPIVEHIKGTWSREA
jgi:hypothetical protein